VSVIVTAFNAERYLADSLASVLASSHRELEVIVVDDGSSDSTAEIIERCAATDTRVLPLLSAHRGRRAALEEAHAAANGAVHCWVDADDVVHRRGIEYALRRLDPEHQLVYTYRDLIDVNGAQLGPHLKNKIPYEPARLLVDNMVFHLRLFTAELFATSGGVGRYESAIDWDMNLRMTELTTPACVPQSLYSYRQHAERMSTSPMQAACGQAAVRDAIARRGLAVDLVIDDVGWRLRRH
jgi:glycosyltransferase involved in cell wall biosynthesis